MLRTILELAHYTEKDVGALRGLLHTFKIRYAEYIYFFGLLGFTFSVIVTLIVFRPTEMLHTFLESADQAEKNTV